MSNSQLINLWFVPVDLLLLAIFLWLPCMSKERAFFGVRVDSEFYRGDGRGIRNSYWVTLVGLFVLVEGTGYSLSTRFDLPLVAVFAHLTTTGAAFVTYIFYARRVSAFAVKVTASRVASPIQARSIRDFTHYWIEAVVILLTLGAFVITAYYYPQIPERMPIHFDFAGNPDRWGQKSTTAMFYLPSLSLYIQICVLVIKNDLAKARMTLPGNDTAEFWRGKERYLLINLKLTDVIRVALALTFFIVSLLVISTTVSTLNRFTKIIVVALWITIAGMLGCCGYAIWRMKRINDEMRSTLGESYVQRQADEEHWRSGGLAYYNPDDPALVVEKLVGFGYTLNLGHPSIRSRIALLAGSLIFVPWALLAL